MILLFPPVCSFSMSNLNTPHYTLDGTRVIVAVGNRVLLYNAETGDLMESLRGYILSYRSHFHPLHLGHKDIVYCVHFSFDGTRFASG